MNEKSKAFELIEFVWNNEKTDSYLRVNIAMYEAVKLAIISQMKFNKEDFQNIFSKFSGGYWFGVNANGKGYGENFYREAVTSGNISACQSYEAFCNIKPFIDSKGRRLYKGAMYRDNEKRYRVTGFDFSTKKVYLVGYAISDWEEKGKKTLFNFTNNEWNEFRKQIKQLNHFQNDDNAYFMVINAPNTEVHLITGEIGICSLLTGQRGHFELPRVSYQTSKGNVVLFPDEIMPVDINLLQQEINEGYIMLSDGRYLPPKEAVQQCYNAFGIRVGLGDNWEDIYDGWNKEMK